jgi:hypothetical protein
MAATRRDMKSGALNKKAIKRKITDAQGIEGSRKGAGKRRSDGVSRDGAKPQLNGTALEKNAGPNVPHAAKRCGICGSTKLVPIPQPIALTAMQIHPDGTKEVFTPTPRPALAPWDMSPGGRDNFLALSNISRQYAQAARRSDVDELTRVGARVLSALVLAMRFGALKALTGKPTAKQSPLAWAQHFLRVPRTDTPERADEIARWFWDRHRIDVRHHIWDPLLKRHEAVETLLKMIQKCRRSATRPWPFDGERPPHYSAATLVLHAAWAFPRLFPDDFDTFSPTRTAQLAALSAKVDEKLNWERMDNEGIMRAVLVACGMPPAEAKNLTKFMDG